MNIDVMLPISEMAPRTMRLIPFPILPERPIDPDRSRVLALVAVPVGVTDPPNDLPIVKMNVAAGAITPAKFRLMTFTMVPAVPIDPVKVINRAFRDEILPVGVTEDVKNLETAFVIIPDVAIDPNRFRVVVLTIAPDNDIDPASERVPAPEVAIAPLGVMPPVNLRLTALTTAPTGVRLPASTL